MRIRIPDKFNTALAVVLMTLVCLSCSDRHDPPVPGPDPDLQTTFEPATCAVPVYRSPEIGGDMQGVIETCFPMRGELGQARIAVFSEADVLNDPNKINRHYELGGIVILLKPTNEAYEHLVEGFEHPDAMPDFPGNGIFLFAYDRDHNRYTISDVASEEEEEDELTTDIEEDLIKAGAGEYDDENLPDKQDVAEEHAHDLQYFCRRLVPFIEWLNETMEESRSGTLSRADAEGYDPRVDISTSYEEYDIQVPVRLHHKIRKIKGKTKADYLNADGEIKIKTRIYPLFQFSQNGSAAGDYYIVEATITAYNQQLWNCDYHTHGGMRSYIIGYYMKQLNVSFQLCDTDGKPVPKLNFYSEPNPQNVNSSTTYTNSTTYGCNFAVSGGYSQVNGWQGNVNGGFSASWTSGESYSLQDVATILDSQNSIVSYRYDVQNISHNKEYTNSKNGKGYPLLSRAEMTAHSTWIWHVPYGKTTVEDNGNETFVLAVKANSKYGCYSWYRPKTTPREDVFDNDKYNWSQPIWRPDRRRFGVLALKNAGPNTVANIVVQKKNENGGFDNFEVIRSSYNTNDVARIKLFEGIYRIKYNTIDTSDGNKITGSWTTPDCVVHMGKDEKASTVEVSTVNATKD